MYNDNSRKRPRPSDCDRQPPAKRRTPHSSSSGGGEQTVSDFNRYSSPDATPYRACPNDYDRKQRACPSSRGDQHSHSGSSQHSSLATILTLSQAENAFRNLNNIQHDKRETPAQKYNLITQQLTNIVELFNRNINETEQYVNKRPLIKLVSS